MNSKVPGTIRKEEGKFIGKKKKEINKRKQKDGNKKERMRARK